MLRFLSRVFLVAFVLQIVNCKTHAQSSNFLIKHFVKNNKVLLRWASPDKEFWHQGNKYGYLVERIELNSISLPDTSAFRVSTMLTKFPIKPRPDTDTAYWKSLIKLNPNAAILYSALYPKVGKKQITAKQKDDDNQLLFGLVLISSDQSAEIAKAAGLYFTDSTISNNTIYAYRVRLFNSAKNIIAQQAIAVVDARSLTQLPKIDSLSGRFENKKNALRWNLINNKKHFAAYIIERSDDSVIFSAVTKVPYVLAYTQYEKVRNYAESTDTVPKINTPYYYRVRGLSHFGELGPPGNVIRIAAKVAINGFPIIDSTNINSKKQVSIFWTLPSTIELKLVKSLTVCRSTKIDGRYKNINSSIIPPATLNFTDEKPEQSTYYKIGAISLSNDTVFSFPVMVQVEDQEPPKIPRGLSGTINNLGIVNLQWNSNAEIDLKGYRVFKSNSPTDELVEVTKKIISDTTFIDTINTNTLTKNIYYSIVALDLVYNNSGYSSPIKIHRLDKYPPVPAIIQGIKFDKYGINIKWIKSTSDDVNKYTLERQDKNQPTKTSTIKTWFVADSTTIFSDTSAIKGNTYSYTLSTIDSSENVSTFVSSALHFEPGDRDKISNFSVSTNRTERKIILNWKYPSQEIQSFIVYKAKKEEPLRIIKTLTSEISNYVDSEVSISNVYVYAIKAIFLNGAESELSDVIEVNY